MIILTRLCSSIEAYQCTVLNKKIKKIEEESHSWRTEKRKAAKKLLLLNSHWSLETNKQVSSEPPWFWGGFQRSTWSARIIRKSAGNFAMSLRNKLEFLSLRWDFSWLCLNPSLNYRLQPVGAITDSHPSTPKPLSCLFIATHVYCGPI